MACNSQQVDVFADAVQPSPRHQRGATISFQPSTLLVEQQQQAQKDQEYEMMAADMLVEEQSGMGFGRLQPINQAYTMATTNESFIDANDYKQTPIARRNGFDCPLGASQIASWVLTAYIFTSFVLTVTAHLQQGKLADNEKFGLCLLSALYMIAFIGMIITTYLVTISDPTDPTVAFERHVKQEGMFEQQEDFIANRATYECNICQTQVFQGSKHCAVCNRCCADFDHHCRWVSNDIGRLNYVLFLRMLLFVAAVLIFQIALSMFTLSSDLTQTTMITEHLYFNAFIEPQQLKVMNWTTLALCILQLCLIGYLIVYHAWLMSQGMSTFQYILLAEDRSQSKVVTKVVEEDAKDDENGRVVQKRDHFTWAQVFGCHKQKITAIHEISAAYKNLKGLKNTADGMQDRLL